jgi:hypothetical protein
MNQQGRQGTSTTRLYLTPADHGRRLSLEEFESADAQAGFRYELIHHPRRGGRHLHHPPAA